MIQVECNGCNVVRLNITSISSTSSFIPVKICLPSKIVTYSSNCDTETLLVEINLRKRK